MKMSRNIQRKLAVLGLLGSVVCWAGSDAGSEQQYWLKGGNQRDVVLNVPPESLCHKDEWIVFSCSVKKDKIVSVCASSDLTPTTGYMQYRFGSYNQKPDMIYPSRLVQPHNYFVFYMKSEGNSGSLALGFHVHAYQYSVYAHGTDAIHGYNGGGVIVRHNGKRVSVMRCLGDNYYVPTSSNNGPSKYIGDFILDDLGLPAPKAGIDFIYK